MTGLAVANVAGNLAGALPCSLAALPRLTELNVRRNALTSLAFGDGGAGGPPVLARLYASHNRILAVDDLVALSALTALRDLELDGNPLASINHPNVRRSLDYDHDVRRGPLLPARHAGTGDAT